jgi:hypothetical protein
VYVGMWVGAYVSGCVCVCVGVCVVVCLVGAQSRFVVGGVSILRVVW